MCGILGSINIDSKVIFNALETLIHRGPDARGFFDEDNVSLGHTRLSIVDLNESANQPFIIGGDVLVYNGEIYNSTKLKYKLLERGLFLKTNSDTEILLLWLVTFGIEAINEVEGMFAFAWYSRDNGRLILCRDQLGIKPLYFYHQDSVLLFSSEIKAILEIKPDAKIIDHKQIAEFLLLGFLYEPDTGFRDIAKVYPGTYQIYNLEGNNVETVVYWSVESCNMITNDVIRSESHIEKLIDESVNNHLTGDVPIGLFFSGGIDSSILLSRLTSNFHPLTICSPSSSYATSGMVDDRAYAREICRKLGRSTEEVELNLEQLSCDNFKNILQDIVVGNEELMSDFTFLSSLLISKEARNKGFKVMLSGMGADEIFGGYPRYKLLKFRQLYSTLFPILYFLRRKKSISKKYSRLKSFLNENSFIYSYNSLIGVFNRKDVSKLLKATIYSESLERFEKKLENRLKQVESLSELRKAMFLDLTGFLTHNFMVADKSSMLASIELRVPLATKTLLEATWQLSDREIISIFNTKILLKKILRKILPWNLVYRRKAGFNAPMDHLIHGLGEKAISDIFLQNNFFEVIDKTEVDEIIKAHFTNSINNTYKIYQLLYLSFWIKRYS